MKVAIIGAGFTGLAAAVTLVDAGHEVTIYEKEKTLGGLAAFFRGEKWKWSLEKYYHHIFTSDKDILEMAQKVGVEVFFKKPETNCLIDGEIWPLDSPLSVLRFGKMSIAGRLRMGFGLALLKIIPNGQFLEKWRVAELLPKLIGREGYEVVWRKLLAAKFGSRMEKINMAWFWARVAKRSAKLGYFKGGFGELLEKMAIYVIDRGGKIEYGKEIVMEKIKADKILTTAPGKGVEHLWGQTLVMECKRSLMKGYWLNILENDWPFLVAVEHTNFVDRTVYNGKYILYFGNYLQDGDYRLKLKSEELLELYWPFIKKINPKMQRADLGQIWKFQDAKAQPIFGVDYSQSLPSFKINNRIYQANMSMVYPYDRGTNYAIRMGREVGVIIDRTK